MSDKVQLIVGLGNPGAQYDRTRHNAGADLVSALASLCHAEMRHESRFHGQYAKTNWQGQSLHLLIPTTFMNLSGQAVQALCSFYKLPPEAVLVVHDELDIPPGQARFKKGGGHGGHNGLKDIISRFGGNREFHRLRIGIGHPGHAGMVAGFVLTKAPQAEQQLIEQASDAALSALPLALSGDWSKAMNQLHAFKP
ncbi:aminoacyl-tRNA hydrolase [Pokkaliibacter plantistimulans]|uniref:Peptidyl-tRNA hydrolase n=1 Tax=Proteobacteria bacterium 228 TaxID=2083153 RepID=A0A2S5KJH6_9PROT|nr:aminoacyl-tRNA hydrolase [Pokkaliibacter plantistimulans]PPC74938.1 aminoacyl-tRNA hydrolase [Pokkaliibacter plantistimulans]